VIGDRWAAGLERCRRSMAGARGPDNQGRNSGESSTCRPSNILSALYGTSTNVSIRFAISSMVTWNCKLCVAPDSRPIVQKTERPTIRSKALRSGLALAQVLGGQERASLPGPASNERTSSDRTRAFPAELPIGHTDDQPSHTTCDPTRTRSCYALGGEIRHTDRKGRAAGYNACTAGPSSR